MDGLIRSQKNTLHSSKVTLVYNRRMGFNIPTLAKPPEDEMFFGEQTPKPYTLPQPLRQLMVAVWQGSSPCHKHLSQSHLWLEMCKYNNAHDPTEWWKSLSKAAVWVPAAW